jgi:hypothetical protein
MHREQVVAIGVWCVEDSAYDSRCRWHGMGLLVVVSTRAE